MTQQQYLVLKQPTRKLKIRIDLIDKNESVISSLEGIATDGGVSLDSDSTYRRSSNLSLILNKENNLLPSPSSKIWFNRRVAIYVGLHSYLDETIWFNLGRFVVQNARATDSGAEKSLSLQLVDYMHLLQNPLTHETRIQNKGITVNQALKSCLMESLTKVSLDNVQVDGSNLTLPYNIEKPHGTNIYEMIKEISEIYMNYEFYFDENGYFILSEIKNRKQDPVVWDFTDINVEIDISNSFNFDNVKNSVWVWGRKDEYGVQTYTNMRNRFSRDTTISRDSIASKDKNDICYVISEDKSYIWSGSAWSLLDFNVIPMFNIENIGEKIEVASEDNIQTDLQAYTKARHMLTKTKHFAETVSISCIPLYSIKPNQKIKIENPDVGISGEYIVTRASVPLDISTPMTIEAEKLYY